MIWLGLHQMFKGSWHRSERREDLMDPRSRGQNRNLSKKESNKNLKIDLLPKRQIISLHSKGLWEQRPGSNPRGSCASTDSRTNLKDKPVRITCVWHMDPSGTFALKIKIQEKVEKSARGKTVEQFLCNSHIPGSNCKAESAQGERSMFY